MSRGNFGARPGERYGWTQGVRYGAETERPTRATYDELRDKALELESEQRGRAAGSREWTLLDRSLTATLAGMRKAEAKRREVPQEIVK